MEGRFRTSWLIGGNTAFFIRLFQSESPWDGGLLQAMVAVRTQGLEGPKRVKFEVETLAADVWTWL